MSLQHTDRAPRDFFAMPQGCASTARSVATSVLAMAVLASTASTPVAAVMQVASTTTAS